MLLLTGIKGAPGRRPGAPGTSETGYLMDRQGASKGYIFKGQIVSSASIGQVSNVGLWAATNCNLTHKWGDIKVRLEHLERSVLFRRSSTRNNQ